MKYLVFFILVSIIAFALYYVNENRSEVADNIDKVSEALREDAAEEPLLSFDDFDDPVQPPPPPEQTTALPPLPPKPSAQQRIDEIDAAVEERVNNLDSAAEQHLIQLQGE
jgi:hypothetical protein